MLKSVSQIKISGGCEVFAQGCITFVPSDNGLVKVQIDNSGQHFYDVNSECMPSFEIDIQMGQLSRLIDNWIELIDTVKIETDSFNTRNAVVTFDFFLQDSEFNFTGSENKNGYQLDPLIDAIEEFVSLCHQQLNQSLSSNPVFSPKNKTEKFLGDEKKKQKAVFQFNDLNGLHGGRLVVVTGMGNVMVQLVFPDEKTNKMWEKRYSFNIAAEQVNKIITSIIDNDILTIELEDRTGVPDEIRIDFSITNAANDFFQLETWEQSFLLPDDYLNHPRARFDKVCQELKRIEHLARTEQEPVQQGPYLTDNQNG